MIVIWLLLFGRIIGEADTNKTEINYLKTIALSTH